MAAKPYQISVPQEQIDILRAKLESTVFPDELADAGWDMGAPLTDVKRMVKKWQTWDWRQAEERLNRIPQYHIPIKVDGFEELDIHFVWQRSEVKNAIPLLFVHGWPGSFIEVRKLLPILSAPGGPAFHIVAPSLPNFGFSSGVKSRGFALRQYAETCHKLMLSLGYAQYATQGGDWGFFVTRTMGLLYPSSCKASHINFVRASPPTFRQHPVLALQHAVTPYSARDKQGLARAAWFGRDESAYSAVQATKPQNIAYAFADSPVALLSWIYDKLHFWTDAYPWTDEEVIEWVSIYAFSTAGPGAAQRIYYESRRPGAGDEATRKRTTEWIGGVPLGISFNPKELGSFPETWARTLGPVVFESHNEKGGHFMSHEIPEQLGKELKTMFGKGGGAFGVVEGKNGYDDVTARL